MNKVAIFVEGKTEQVFVKKLIEEYIGFQKGLLIKISNLRGESIFLARTAAEGRPRIISKTKNRPG